MRFFTLPLVIALCLLWGCQSSNSTANSSENKNPPKKQRPLAYKAGKIFNTNGRKMLYGGMDTSQHFDISNCSLNDQQFHYGIGREQFPALLEPRFISVAAADSLWPDTARFLVAKGETVVKAYSVPDLTRHEVVNDRIDGEPIMAAYCILADLGAIYSRQYGDTELTFALSGYTYYDENVWDGLDGFVFWDRETESLWWPLIGKAVSGPLKDVGLLEWDKNRWEDTDWKTLKQKYPDARVLESGQDFERPRSWKKLDDTQAIVRNFSVVE